MKFGDVVIYKEFGREYPALVLSTRELEHHGGENGEPLINLAFVREVKDGSGSVINVSGTAREAEAIQFRHDVAHDSHEFTEEAKEELIKSGLLPPGGSISGGRYVEGVALKSEQTKDAAVPVASTEGSALTGDSQAASTNAPAQAGSDPASDDAGDAQSEEPKTTVQ